MHTGVTEVVAEFAGMRQHPRLTVFGRISGWHRCCLRLLTYANGVQQIRESDSKKLAALAELTGRGQGEVLRLLLKQAVVASRPDIQLSEPLVATPQTEMEKAHVS